MAEPSDPPRLKLALSVGVAAYSEEGHGRPMVLLHGLPGSGRDFRWLAPPLRAAARVIRVDMPGFGETPPARDPSPEGRARFVLAMMDALEIERAIALGHSMGGVIAAAAASLAPDRFAGLALLSTPGLRPHRMMRLTPFRAASAILERPHLGPALAPLLRRAFAAAGFRNYPDHELYRTMHLVARTSIAEHAARVRALALPTFVAWCEDDPIIEPEIAEELATACPEGPRHRFERGGHNPQKHHAEALGAALLAWQRTL